MALSEPSLAYAVTPKYQVPAVRLLTKYVVMLAFAICTTWERLAAEVP